MTTIGTIFLPQWAPERLRSIAVAADEAGVEELWVWEDCFFESGIAAATAALAWTERIRLGIGVLPVPLRNVAITAMEVATMARLFPGRLRLGIGHGVQDWMGQVGSRADSPLTLLREYAVALRALLAGEEVSAGGAYVNLEKVRLVWPPADVPELLGAATGPRTLRLCGEVADGTVLTAGSSPARVREARARIDEGRARGGRTGPHPVAVYVHAATGPTAQERLERERVQWGYDSLDGIAIHGDAADFAEAIHAYAKAGADTVVLQPTPDDPDPEGFMRFVGTQVTPII